MCLNDMLLRALPLLLWLPAASVLAAQEPVNIEADRMQMRLESGSSIYTGNVSLSRGTMRLTGDRLIVDRPDPELMQVEVFGDPARFEQTSQDDVTRAESRRMRYDSSTEILTLEQDARLDHDRQLIESDLIRFDTNRETLLAGGNTGAETDAEDSKQRVNIILEPAGGNR